MPRNQQRSQLSSAYCTTSRNGGEVTTSETELAGSSRVASAGSVDEARAVGHAGQRVANCGRDVAEELFGFLENEFGDVAARRGLLSLLVDLALRFDGHGLVGRQRINGKESGRVAGETIERNHRKQRQASKRSFQSSDMRVLIAPWQRAALEPRSIKYFFSAQISRSVSG